MKLQSKKLRSRNYGRSRNIMEHWVAFFSLEFHKIKAIIMDSMELDEFNEFNDFSDIYDSDSVPKPLSEALLSFSLLLNLSKLFSLDVGTDTLAPIHGLRFLSIIWVILVHTCLTVNAISGK